MKLSTRKFSNFIAAPMLYRLPAAVIGSFVVSDPEVLPDPAREAIDKPHLPAEDLEREIGDSEAWDEASEDTGSDPTNDR
jgi:hypothetical protein